MDSADCEKSLWCAWSKIANYEKQMKERYLLLDFLRLFAVMLVVFQHLISWKWSTWTFLQPLNLNWNPFGLVLVEWGAIGVSILFFVSGCSLALNRSSADSRVGVKRFYLDRLLRIYPVFWLACLLSIVTFPERLPATTPLDYSKDFSGFQAFGALSYNDFVGMTAGAYWFVGVLLCLYFLYPVILAAMKRNPHLSIFSLFLISLGSRALMAFVFPFFYRGIDWFPLCQVFTFGLGVYIIRIGKYPKWINRSNLLAFASKSSFYIYLVHAPLLFLVQYDSFVLFVISTTVFTCVFYIFDKRIEQFVKSKWKHVLE